MSNECPMTGKPCPNVKNVKVSQITPSGYQEFNLCVACAAPYVSNHPNFVALPTQTASFINAPLMQMLKLINVLLEKEDYRLHLVEQACPRCNHTLMDFKGTGRLGCDNCYVYFHEFLRHLIPQVQDGHIVHQGKVPKNGGKVSLPTVPSTETFAPNDDEAISLLETKMQKAVKDERYEDAAVIRDMICKLKDMGKPPAT